MRTLLQVSFLALTAGALAACTAPRKAPDAMNSAQTTAPASALPAPDRLSALSCPPGTQHIAPKRIQIMAEPVALSDRAGQGRLPPGVRFAGGWALTSDHAGFGGLSGLEHLDDGSLLAITDMGAFVRIGMQDGAPDGTGAFSYMLGPDGSQLSGKRDGDSEGLALKHGLAFVSFERRHRIAAFDLDRCGAAARAAPVADLPDRIGDTEIRENSGAEALSVGEGLLAGYEQLVEGRSPLVNLSAEAPVILLREAIKPGFGGPLVGMTNRITLGDAATAGSVVYSLRRDYNPVFGNRLSVEAEYTDAGGSSRRGLFRLAAPMTVDNFEGITVETLADATHRLWLVSDDNFSGRQRTLLYAFDLVGEAH